MPAVTRQFPALLGAMLLCLAGAAGAEPVPPAPTAPDAVPDAILGKGAAPRGTMVSYHVGNPKAVGYLAEPAGQGLHGAVILIHEWNGLVERIKQTADAFAAEGYVALAVDLYSGRKGSNPEENMQLVQETLADPDEVVRNLDAAATFLKSRKDVTGKVATIGWCFGGGVALSFAIGNENHEGTAIFYGSLLDDPEKMKHIHHEVYGTFAGLDRRITREHVDGFVAALRKAGVPNEVHVYDDVEHGFWLYVDRDPEKNLKPALDAWQRLKKYLARTLFATP
jgi:carboxymethylenebutenolidase